MLRRIKLAGQHVNGLSTARFLHTGQGTLKGIIASGDEALAMQIRLGMNHSMELYEKKWGGLPGKETYLVPYESN